MVTIQTDEHFSVLQFVYHFLALHLLSFLFLFLPDLMQSQFM